MASDEAAVRGTPTPQAGRLPFDTSKAHQARMYDYALGGYFLQS